MDSGDRAAAEFVLAEARNRPGVQIVLWDRQGDPRATTEGVLEVAREQGVEAKVEAHPNGLVLVSVVVEADAQ